MIKKSTLILSRKFYKEAALIKIPPKLYKSVSDWVIGAYTNILTGWYKKGLDNLNLKRNTTIVDQDFLEDLEDTRVLYGFCKMMSSNFVEGEISKFHNIIHFNGSDVPYLNSNENFSIEVELIHTDERKIQIDGESTDWSAMWQDYDELDGSVENRLGHLSVSVNIEDDIDFIDDIQSLQEMFDEIRRNIAHELEHMIQTYIKYVKNLHEDGGLPSKKIRDNKPGQTQDSNKMNDIEHDLVDSEFYTQIGNVVELWRISKPKFPRSLHEKLVLLFVDQISRKDFINLIASYLHKVRDQYSEEGLAIVRENMIWAIDEITGPDNTLNVFRDHSWGKYKKAIKEFLKEIQQ